MIAIEASLDCRYGRERVEFWLFGADESDHSCGTQTLCGGPPCGPPQSQPRCLPNSTTALVTALICTLPQACNH